MKKVLIITYYWPPSGGAGVQRWLKFAKYLPEFGWEPIVLTVDPSVASYPQIDESLLECAKGIETHKTNTFELYNFYSKLMKGKQIPYGGFSNESEPSFLQKVMRFVRGNFFIPDPRKGWNSYALKEAKQLISKYDIKTVITTSPPHSTQLIGLKLKKELGVNWVADLRDPWTDIYYYDKFYPTKFARSIDKSYEAKIVKNCDLMLTVSPSIQETFVKNYGFESKTKVLTNGFDTFDFSEKLFSNISLKKEVLYTGTITSDYPMHETLALAQKLKDYSFRFIGNVPSVFVKMVEQAGLTDRFSFQNAISHEDILKEMVQAEILLLLIPKVDKNEGILTGKLFEYLGSRRPILAIGPKGGDVAQVLEQTQSGFYIEYDEVAQIEFTENDQSLERVLNEEYIRFSRKEISQKLAELLEETNAN